MAKIMVKTLPYDPRDLISGQYIRLRYDFNGQVKGFNNKHYTNDRWSILREVDGFYELKTTLNHKPENLQDNDKVKKPLLFLRDRFNGCNKGG